MLQQWPSIADLVSLVAGVCCVVVGLAIFMEVFDKICFIPVLGILLLSMKCTMDKDDTSALQCLSSTLCF